MSHSLPLLSASHLTSGYGPSQVLRDISLDVGAHETIGLLGRNGMGKTTLLRTLMGLIEPGPNASLTFKGRNVTRKHPAAMSQAGLALVPEGRGIFPNLSVEENLNFAARQGPDGRRDWTQERIFSMFPRLAERRKNWGDQLSGGEQQMLSISRALMTNPSLILLDEATEGLAPKIRDEIWSILRIIAETGVSIVVVDKNLDDLFDLATRHIVLAKGEIVFTGTSKDLKDNPDIVHRWLGV